LLNLPEAFATDGSQFQRLFADNEIVEAGKIRFKVIYTPGHTPACVSYLFSNSVFVGDVLFMPDYGVGRCDFPNGVAEALYDSITKRLFTLPDATAVYVCHDYQPGGRALQYQTTIGETKVSNIQLNATTKAGDFVRFRRTRDATLSAPRLLYPSIQVNIAAGRLPDKEKNGQAYLKLPIFNS
jgi:glyoxylase-like metal-dependent hydrolase (beta-lactamase superfamily II)